MDTRLRLSFLMDIMLNWDMMSNWKVMLNWGVMHYM